MWHYSSGQEGCAGFIGWQKSVKCKCKKQNQGRQKKNTRSRQGVIWQLKQQRNPKTEFVTNQRNKVNRQGIPVEEILWAGVNRLLMNWMHYKWKKLGKQDLINDFYYRPLNGGVEWHVLKSKTQTVALSPPSIQRLSFGFIHFILMNIQ